jgi:phytoene dehydrogenase-like protein
MTSAEYDTIVIGSGAGGLSAAICLAKEGQKVLVIEQHDVPGGWCHSFYLDGHRFTPGVHYIGLMDKGQSTSVLYEGLGIANDLVFFRMNPKGFEHCRIGDERFDYPANYEDLVTNLSERFPKERKNIAAYLKLIRNVSSQLELIPKVKTLWDHITIPFRTKHMGKYALFSLKRVINWHIKDPLLKKILNIQFGDHGLSPAKASFPLHAAVMGHYFSGGFYPMGGGGAIIKAMTKGLKSKKGQIRTSAKVSRILLKGTNKKTAIGVQLESGEQLFAKRIISNADPGITYLDLIGKENLSKRLIKKLEKTTYSCTSLMLFLTVDMDLRKAGLDSGNIWLMVEGDMDQVYEEMMHPEILAADEFPGMFVSCTTMKDPSSFNGKHHTIEAITYIDYESFRKFEDEHFERSEAYLAFKEQLMNKMIRTLEKVIPNVRNHIIQKELGTPITNRHYINSSNGSVYGTEKKFRQIGPFSFKPKSEIKNLYLCGASIASHGIAGASYSGVQTAGVILGMLQDDLIKMDPAQDIRIYPAEDKSQYPAWMLKKIAVKEARLASVVPT